MINKSVSIIICMYCVCMSVLVGQYVIGDIFEMTLTNYKGEPIRSELIALVNFDAINRASENIIESKDDHGNNSFDRVLEFNVGMAYAVFEFITILSGTYIFYFMFLMGLPLPFVMIFVVPYTILFIRTFVGLLRGI